MAAEAPNTTGIWMSALKIDAQGGRARTAKAPNTTGIWTSGLKTNAAETPNTTTNWEVM